jgi:hypothetical protein
LPQTEIHGGLVRLEAASAGCLVFAVALVLVLLQRHVEIECVIALVERKPDECVLALLILYAQHEVTPRVDGALHSTGRHGCLGEGGALLVHQGDFRLTPLGSDD